MTLTVLLNPDFLNPKSTGLGIVEDYYRAKFQVIPLWGFPFIAVTTSTQPPHNPSTHTHHEKVTTVGGAVLYAENQEINSSARKD